MGEEISVLESREKWSLIRCVNDGYEGWIDNKQFALFDAAEIDLRLSAAVTCCILPNRDVVWLPAGSRIPSRSVLNHTQPNWTGSRSDIAACAKQFLNAPYLWGGRTILGIDCSGFTQIVFALNDYTLPRDAYQQAEAGDNVAFIEESQAGDLAFFDNAEGRIVHVGIIISDESDQRLIIHASGKVRIDVIDHQGIYNRDAGLYTHQLRIIKRIVQAH